jgi:hypothetical protein
MTGETNEGARRVRVVPRQGPGGPQAGPRPVGPPPVAPPPLARPPLDAETEVMPRVAPAAPAAGTDAPAGDVPAAAAADAERRGRASGDDAGTAEGTERRNGMGTPALVLGLLAAGTCWTGWAGVVLGLFGVAAGYLGARRAWNGLATDGASSLGGLALGAIGLVVGVIVVWPTLFGTGNFGDGLTLDQCLQQANGAFEMHMCKSQHITEFNQRFPNAAT